MLSSSGQFIQKLGKFIEKIKFTQNIRTESELELSILPDIEDFIQKELPTQDKDTPVFYHHGTTKEEKLLWSKSKTLQTVHLFGSNVSDMFIFHHKIGAVTIEFKYTKSNKLTSQIQRAIGQSIIATMRHPFAICVIVYKKCRKIPDARIF